jgi:hypothetical protein
MGSGVCLPLQGTRECCFFEIWSFTDTFLFVCILVGGLRGLGGRGDLVYGGGFATGKQEG